MFEATVFAGGSRGRRPSRGAPVIALLAALGLAGCQAAVVDADPMVVAALQSSTAQRFAANAAGFPVQSEAERAVLAVVRNNLEEGYNTSDPALIGAALASNFEFRLATARDSVMIEKRAGFLEGFENWGGSGDRRLIYTVNSIKVDADGNSAAVVALSTFRSRHFNPRFLETLLFNKERGAWKLAKRVLLPLHPSRPESHEVAVYVTRPFWAEKPDAPFSAFLARTTAERGPDSAIDMLAEKSAPAGDGPSHIVAVFREPPTVGTEITFHVTMIMENDEATFTSRIPVTQETSFFVAESIAHAKPAVTGIVVDVVVDGIKIATRKAAFRAP